MIHLLAQYTTTTSSSSSAGAGFALVFLAFYVVIGGFVLFAWSRIIGKAGYSPWWCLIGLVPCVGIVMFFVFAFAQWPALQGTGRGMPPGGYSYGGPGGYAPPARPGTYAGVPGGTYGGPNPAAAPPAAPAPPGWGAAPPAAAPPQDAPPAPPTWGTPPPPPSS